ncbi:hypothetical protein MOUN0_L09956 [Monosporozyma unispora]|nr:hypothetical protein C6P44_005464 [Kazachstania unispora]
MCQGECSDEGNIVLMCDFCHKYNISYERAMAMGIDNSYMERITEEEFENILNCSIEDQKELTFKEGKSLIFPFEGEQVEIDTNVSLSQLFEGDTFTTKPSLNSVKLQRNENIPRCFALNKPSSQPSLLYSEVTASDTKYDLLESSLPPAEKHPTILISEDYTIEQEQTHTLLYTSES